MFRRGKASSLLTVLLAIFSMQLLLSIEIATSQTLDSNHRADYSLFGATTYVSGILTDLQFDNSSYISFGSSYAGTDDLDFVDNNESDVDSSPDRGSHSNFAAQQYGPDGNCDTLTEVNTGSNGTLDLYVDALDNVRTGWDRLGGSPYLDTQNHPIDHVRLRDDRAEDIGDFSFQNSEKSLETINSVVLRLYAWKEDVGDRLGVYLWDSSSWDTAYTITRTSVGWTEFDVTARLDTWAKIDGAKIYLNGDTTVSENSRLLADCAVLRVDYDLINYELDLEVQWANATCDMSNAELCIFGGTMGSENICVHVWNGSTWHNLFTDLSSGWNNISVTNYLVSPTFSIRFKGGTETGDTSQDSWEIDCTLLHTWVVPPIANFSYIPKSPYTGETVTFNASDSYDPDGYIVDYCWNFGDGTNATGVTVSHAYSEDGSYTVNLTVTDDEGSSVVASDVLTILNRAPVASFVILPQQLTTDDMIIFNATDSYDPDGTIVNYTWNFGDGNITTTSSSVVTHIYHEYGDLNVTLTVIDNDGYDDSTSQVINVHVYDVAILNATVSQAEVHVGQVVNITVAARNKGTTTESFNVTVFRNETLIGTQLISDLAPDAEMILNFYWNTTGVTPNVRYTIKAEASAVPGETDIVDNTYTYGIVKVKSQDPPPFDWGPIIPYLATVSSAVVAVIVAIAVKKELLGLLLGALGGLSWWKKRKKRKGFEFFDEMTNGGIPDSFSVLISGEPGSGKSMLCQQLTHMFLVRGNSCIYITYDSFPDEVRENMEKLHWNISKYENEGKLMFIDSFSSIAKVTSKEKYSVDQPFSLSDLGITMSQATNERADVPKVFLDSIVPLLTHVAPAKVVEFLQKRSARIKGVEGTFIFSIGKDTIELNLMSRLEEVVDCVIELEVSKGKTVRRMHIKKMRGRKISSKWIRFEIDSKKGIVFLV